MDVLKPLEKEVKQLRAILSDKEDSIISLNKQLDLERDEKMMLLQEKEKDEREKEELKKIWSKENEELRKKINEMIEISKKEDTASVSRTRLLSEIDSDEIHHAYQKTIKDKEYLENEIIVLKSEISNLSQMVGVKNPNFVTHSRSISNASSQNEEDFGYSSSKNTLESKKVESENYKLSNELLNSNMKQEKDDSLKKSGGQIAIILRLRKLLEDEKNKNLFLENQAQRIQSKTNPSVNNEDLLK